MRLGNKSNCQSNALSHAHSTNLDHTENENEIGQMLETIVGVLKSMLIFGIGAIEGLEWKNFNSFVLNWVNYLSYFISGQTTPKE